MIFSLVLGDRSPDYKACYIGGIMISMTRSFMFLGGGNSKIEDDNRGVSGDRQTQLRSEVNALHNDKQINETMTCPWIPSEDKYSVFRAQVAEKYPAINEKFQEKDTQCLKGIGKVGLGVTQTGLSARLGPTGSVAAEVASEVSGISSGTRRAFDGVKDIQESYSVDFLKKEEDR